VRRQPSGASGGRVVRFNLTGLTDNLDVGAGFDLNNNRVLEPTEVVQTFSGPAGGTVTIPEVATSNPAGRALMLVVRGAPSSVFGTNYTVSFTRIVASIPTVNVGNLATFFPAQDLLPLVSAFTHAARTAGRRAVDRFVRRRYSSEPKKGQLRSVRINP
jgi:hypothetical protein